MSDVLQTKVKGLVIQQIEFEYENEIHRWWCYYHEASNTRIKFFNAIQPEELISFSGAFAVFDWTKSIEELAAETNANLEKFIFIRETFDQIFPNYKMIKLA